jgi:predicted DNA-binding transcriptional regulator YafY
MTLEVLKNCAMTMFLEEHIGYAGVDTLPQHKEQRPATTPIIETLNKAIADKQEIWISYNGGSNPQVPRKIKPLKWLHEPWLIEAFCYQGQCNKQFAQRKICEISNEEWEIKRENVKHESSE